MKQKKKNKNKKTKKKQKTKKQQAALSWVSVSFFPVVIDIMKSSVYTFRHIHPYTTIHVIMKWRNINVKMIIISKKLP